MEGGGLLGRAGSRRGVTTLLWVMRSMCAYTGLMCRREGSQVLVSTLLEECGNSARSLDAVHLVDALLKVTPLRQNDSFRISIWCANKLAAWQPLRH